MELVHHKRINPWRSTAFHHTSRGLSATGINCFVFILFYFYLFILFYFILFLSELPNNEVHFLSFVLNLFTQFFFRYGLFISLVWNKNCDSMKNEIKLEAKITNLKLNLLQFIRFLLFRYYWLFYYFLHIYLFFYVL